MRPVSKYEPKEYVNRTIREDENGEEYFIYRKRRYYPDADRGRIAYRNIVIEYELYGNTALLTIYKKIA